MKGETMSLIRVTAVPKFVEDGSETEVFKGTLEQLYLKFGTKEMNPLVGYVSKNIQYVYRFYRWTRAHGWIRIDDPRSQR
jgi:hypothetical protein